MRNKNESKSLDIEITADIVSTNVFIETKDRYRYENCIRFVVSDNGEGFLQSVSAFDIFDRSHLLKEKMDIGLAYCRKIVQLLNGTITVASEREKGTRFTILFPLKTD